MYPDTEIDGIPPSLSASPRLCFTTLSSRRLGRLTTRLTGLRPSILDLLCLSGCERTRGVTLLGPSVLLFSFNCPIAKIIKCFNWDGLARHHGSLLTAIPKPSFTNICLAPAPWPLSSSPLILYFPRSELHYSFFDSSLLLFWITLFIAFWPFLPFLNSPPRTRSVPNVVIVVIWPCFSLLPLLYCCILALLCVLHLSF